MIGLDTLVILVSSVAVGFGLGQFTAFSDPETGSSSDGRAADDHCGVHDCRAYVGLAFEVDDVISQRPRLASRARDECVQRFSLPPTSRDTRELTCALT